MKHTPGAVLARVDKAANRSPNSSRSMNVSSTIPPRIATVDGFDNFVSKIGLNNQNALSASTYAFNLVTRNRVLLEATYRGSWIAGAVIDSVAEDMTRAGIDITTSDEADLKILFKAMTRLQIWDSLESNIKWGRLYGGSIGVIQIRGQDLATPLNLDSIGKGQFEGIAVFDRWQLNPSVSEIIMTGPDMGLPKFYDIVSSPQSYAPAPSEWTMTGQIRVHHSRCIRSIGIQLPFFQAITEMMWGEAILERLWDRLIAFDNATMSSASLIDRANLRRVGVQGLREIIAAGGEAQEGLVAMFKMMELLELNMGLTLLDKDDEHSTESYTFTGLPEMMLQYGQQLAGAAEIPLIRLFGQPPAGLGDGGDSVIRMYYDSINAKQESKLRRPVATVLNVLWRSVYGKEPPEDLEFEFVPLWQMSPAEKATVAKTTSDAVGEMKDAGLISAKGAMKELKDSSNQTGIFTNITAEDIENAEEDEVPLPDDLEQPTVLPPKQLTAGTDVSVKPAEPIKSLDAKPNWLQRILKTKATK